MFYDIVFLTRICVCCVCKRLLPQTEKNVLRLDVCMDDLTVCVQIVKTLKHLGINWGKEAGGELLTKIPNVLAPCASSIFLAFGLMDT